jgi:hypothetical protein
MRAGVLVFFAALGVGCSADSPGAVPGLGFREAAAAANLTFQHRSGASGRRRLREIMGGGCALFDADGDGDPDTYLVQGDGPNRFFVNDGTGRFEEATEAAGLGDRGFGMGLAVGDVEGDGDLDVYLSNAGADRIYRNTGGGIFEDATEEAHVEVGGWSTSATFLDTDRDGRLDLWVVRYVHDDRFKQCAGLSGRPDYCNPKALPAERDVLLLNRFDGVDWHFEDGSEAAGILAVAPAAGLGVVSFDVDRDGRQDVFVANDGYPNHVWLNLGNGRFREAAAELGAAFDLNGTAQAGMGVVAADLTRDGRLDLFLTHLTGETNTLYAGVDVGFDDVSARSGLGQISVPFTGFGVAAFDAQLDGDLDLAIANGRVLRAGPHARADNDAPWNEYAEPNAMIENRDGVFVLEPQAWSPETIEISRGLASGDVDGDGDLDLLIAQIEGPVRLWLDESERKGTWLCVRPMEGERIALGTEVELETDAGRQVRLVTHTSSYLSCGSPDAHFGIPDGAIPEELRIRWPDGTEEAFAIGALERVQIVNRGEGRAL